MQYWHADLPDKDGHEQGPCQHMCSNDIQAEIREQHQSQTLHNIKLIGDLRMHVAVCMMCDMFRPKQWQFVHRKMEEEEHSVVDDHAQD